MTRHARGAGARSRLTFLVLVVVIAGVVATGAYLAIRAATGRYAAPRHVSQVKTTSPTAPASTPPPSPPPVGRLGFYRLVRHSYTFTEPASAKHGPRTLRVTVHAPVIPAALDRAQPAGGTFPLVVFAPGYRQCGGSYRDLLRQWASAGYVVAAVEFPLTNCTIAKPDEADLSNQPADVSFVIRRLLALSARPQGALSGLISATKIAVAGHSDGGDTVAAVAAASCCQDRRVRAAIVLAGAEWAPLGGTWFAGPTPPMLFVQGTADTWNPPQASTQLYQADTTGARYYLDLFGANHFTPYEGHGAPEPIVEQVTLDFLNHYVAGENGYLVAMHKAGHVPGIAVLVSRGRMP